MHLSMPRCPANRTHYGQRDNAASLLEPVEEQGMSGKPDIPNTLRRRSSDDMKRLDQSWNAASATLCLPHRACYTGVAQGGHLVSVTSYGGGCQISRLIIIMRVHTQSRPAPCNAGRE